MVLEATPYIVAVGSSTKCADAVGFAALRGLCFEFLSVSAQFLHRVIDCMVQQIPFSTLCSEFDFSPECPTETSITALSVAASSAFQATINTVRPQAGLHCACLIVVLLALAGGFPDHRTSRRLQRRSSCATRGFKNSPTAGCNLAERQSVGRFRLEPPGEQKHSLRFAHFGNGALPSCS